MNSGLKQGRGSTLLDDKREHCRNIALKLLRGRPLTRIEFAHKMKLNGVSPDLAREITDEFVALGYINESDLAEDLVRLAGDKLVGKRLIRQKLAARGLPDELIERELTAQIKAEDEYQAAKVFAEKKLKVMGDVPSEVQLRRVGGALARRGFNSETIRKVLENLNLL